MISLFTKVIVSKVVQHGLYFGADLQNIKKHSKNYWDLGDVGVSKLENYLINAKKHISKTHTKQQIKCARDDTILKEGE